MPDLAAPVLITVSVVALLLLIPAALLGSIFGFITAWGITRRIGRLAGAADAWSRGDLSVRTRDRSRDEIGQLSRELNDMAEDLETCSRLARNSPPSKPATASPETCTTPSSSRSSPPPCRSPPPAPFWSRKSPEDAGEHLAQAHELVRQAQKELNVLIHEMRPAPWRAKGSRRLCGSTPPGGPKRAEITGRGPRPGRAGGPAGGRAGPLPCRPGSPGERRQAQRGRSKAEIDLVYTNESVKLRVADDGAGLRPG